MRKSLRDTRESNLNELKDILNEMDVPEYRKELTQHNIMWLKNNLGVKNNLHDKYFRAIYIIRFLILNKDEEPTV